MKDLIIRPLTASEEPLFDTDVTNTPMAATFAKARYPVIEHRIDFTY